MRYRIPSLRLILPLSVFLVATACLCTSLAASGKEENTISATGPEPGMSIMEAAVLGIIEGLTEFLPISSTGHLILAQRLFGLGANGEKEAADAYAICIQAGAILAVLGVYFSFIRRIFLGLVGRDREGLRLCANLVVAFLPAAVVGLSLHTHIKELLFGLKPVTFAWFVGGVAILAVSRWRKDHSEQPGDEILDMKWYSALLIGFIQCLAVWPGTSRSLVTIVGGVLVGLNLKSAVIFSFLLGAVTLGASTAFDMLTHGKLLMETYGLPSMLTGFVMAFVSAVIAVKWMVNYLKRHGLALFGYYRIILAVIVAGLLAGGILPSE